MRKKPADLSGVHFSDCTIADSYIGNARLFLDRATFERCKLSSVQFMFGQLAGAEFIDTLLLDCHFRSAVLRGAAFRRCKLVSVNLEKADLREAVFDHTELERMEDWGWHGYAGATIPEDQKFRYFIARDVGQRLMTAITNGSLTVSRERLASLRTAIESAGMAHGEAMLIHEEWKDYVSLPEFIVLGRLLTADVDYGRTDA